MQVWNNRRIILQGMLWNIRNAKNYSAGIMYKSKMLYLRSTWHNIISMYKLIYKIISDQNQTPCLDYDIFVKYNNTDNLVWWFGNAGCMFHSERGLMSFEQPSRKMKAMPRIDSEGMMCGANFKVDVQSSVPSMPRVGSEANWAGFGSQTQWWSLILP